MAWCEANGVDFLFGLARTERLVKLRLSSSDEFSLSLENSLRPKGAPRLCEGGSSSSTFPAVFMTLGADVTVDTA